MLALRGGRVAQQLAVVDEAPAEGPRGRGAALISPAKREYMDRYMERVRDKVEVDPVEASIMMIQAEVKEEMAASLGRAGGRLDTALREMEISHRRYCEIRSRFEASTPRERESVELRSELLARARDFNRARTLAEDRRRDLIVQRQAVGFSWRNHEIVSDARAHRARRELTSIEGLTRRSPTSYRYTKPTRCQSLC